MRPFVLTRLFCPVPFSPRRFFADRIIKTPYMADSITQGTLASWEKSRAHRRC